MRTRGTFLREQAKAARTGQAPQVALPPGDLQVELHRAEVVDVHGERLGKWAEQVEHFAGHAAYHHVIGQALQLRHLDNQNMQTLER